MTKSNWVEHLREAFTAVAAGGQFVPLGDNREARHSLAVRLAELRLNARLGGVGDRPRPTAPLFREAPPRT